ncbi:MAG: ribulose-phosphate 3-epimerase [Candidatus Edwardsbacteria bacterium]
MIKIAPSLLACNFSRLKEEIRSVEIGGADLLHLDVMDGHFVPNITFGPMIVSAINRLTKLPLDVHLMIENPEKYLERFVESGADYLTVHAETCPSVQPPFLGEGRGLSDKNLKDVISKIKSLGVKVGLSLNPSTSLNKFEKILGEVDLLLLMTVNPGFGGQKFIFSVISKIKRAKLVIAENSYKTMIEVDGGINRITAPKVIKAGADILVAGIAIFSAKDRRREIERLRGKLGR